MRKKLDRIGRDWRVERKLRRRAAMVSRALYGVDALEPRMLLSGYALSTLASLSVPNGESPENNLVLDANGNLFGATDFGGADGAGTLFEIAKGSSTLTTLASFDGSDNDGTPWPELGYVDGNGNLFGATEQGGGDGEGSIFELVNGSNAITTLASFDVSAGDSPLGGLVADASGNLYGTSGGGDNGDGMIFELANGSNTINEVAAFDGNDGEDPRGGLVMDASGNLFGTTDSGGGNNSGVVFELANGSSTITPLANLDSDVDTQGGDAPELVIDGSGNLFGTTVDGGAHGGGVIFELANGSHTITTRASFASSTGPTDKKFLAIDGGGNLFGTTGPGGAFGVGTAFELANGSHTITTLASFNGADGEFPANVILDGGNLIGTTYAGGTDNEGTIFELSPVGSANKLVFSVQPSTTIAGSAVNPSIAVSVEDQNGHVVSTDNSHITISVEAGPGSLHGSLTVAAVNGIATFNGITLNAAGTYALSARDSADGLANVNSSSFTVNPAGTFQPVLTTLASFDGSNGQNPHSLVLDSSGNLFGATDLGTAFEIPTANNTLTAFSPFDTDDGAPYGNVSFVDSAGDIFGTLDEDGNVSFGIVYEIPSGTQTLTTLATFDNVVGNDPNSLIVDGDGNLFGTTVGNGNSNGTIFEIVNDGSGTITTLASFDGDNGANPLGGLVMDGDGNLFGTTQGGGDFGDGTVFELASGSSTITTLASFDGTNGKSPHDGVVLDGNDNLFGTTQAGGTNSIGTVFEVANGGNAITTLASFNGTNGASPACGVVLDNAGNLFGAAAFGGPGFTAGNPSSGDGTLFEVAEGSNAITTLASFNGTNGFTPTRVALDGNGNLDGVTLYGGANDAGSVFKLALTPPAISLAPSSIAGDTIVVFNVAGTDGNSPPDFSIAKFTSTIVSSQDIFSASPKARSYTYTVTGPTTATVLITTSTGTTTDALSFTSATTGTFHGVGPSLGEEEDAHFVLYAPPAQSLAPSSIMNAKLSLNITMGGAHLPKFGQHAPETAASGNTYTLSGISGGILDSTGTYTYTRGVNGAPGLASITYNDSQFGIGEILLAFTSTEGGTYYATDAINSSGLTDFHTGTFTLSANATHLSFPQPIPSTIAGQIIGPTLTVQLLDASNHLATDDNSTVTLSLLTAQGATLLGTTSVQAVDGVATFNDLVLKVTGQYTLVASDAGLTTGNSKLFTITPDAASSQLALFLNPDSVIVGQPIKSIVLDVQDQFGNVVTTDNSNVTLTVAGGPGGLLAGTATIAAKKGIATFSKASLSLAGSYTLTAADGSLAIPTPVPFDQEIGQGVTTLATPHPASSYNFGQTITLSSTFKSSAPNAIPFTGIADIFDQDSNLLGTATLAAAGAVKFALPTIVSGQVNIAAGSYLCTVSYGGDANHTSFTSNTFTLLIKPAATKTTLQSSATQLTSGQSLTLTASVASTAAPSTPRTGNVTFLDNGTAFGTMALSGSAASTTFVPTPGVNKYTVVYSGDANFLTSNSGAAKSVTYNLAPNSLKGDALFPSTVAGTGDDAPPGGSVVNISGSSNTLAISDLVDNTTTSYTYTYTKISPTSATILITLSGHTLTAHLTFVTSSSGTLQLSSSSGGTSVQDFVLFANPIPNNAPVSIAASPITLTATAGSALFGSSGSIQLSPNASDNSYTFVGISGSNVNSSGTYVYSPVNPAIASFAYSDSVVGTGTLYLAFTSPNAGVYYNINGNDWQAGTFTM